MKFADIVLKSNAVFTGASLTPFKGGVAIKEDKIFAVKEGDEIDAFIGENTKVYQYGDNLVLPGFNDSHFHFAFSCLFDDDTICHDLSSCKSEEECVESLQAFAAKYPNNPWVIAKGVNYLEWDKPVLPNKKLLDKCIPDRPVSIQAWDLHIAWVNSKALEIAKIDRNTPNPSDGHFSKFEDGEPDGIIVDLGAIYYVNKYALCLPDLDKSIKKYLAKLATRGITTVGDVVPMGISNDNVYDAYHKVELEGKLSTRIYFCPKLDEELSEAYLKKYNSPKLKFLGMKKFLDGTCEAHTGYLLEPYSDDPTAKSEAMISLDQLSKEITNANANDIPVRLHAIGDAAVRLGLDCFEASIRKNGDKGLRNSIEHIETINDNDIPRFAKLGVTASMQPQHLTCGIDGYIELLGEKRVQNAWAMKKMLNSGAHLSIGSDCPVVDCDPFLTIHAAVTRTTPAGYPEGGFIPDQKLSMGEVLQGFTAGASYVVNEETRLGTLEEGKFADVIVLDRNLFDVKDAEILETSVLLTISDGKVVYEK